MEDVARRDVKDDKQLINFHQKKSHNLEGFTHHLRVGGSTGNDNSDEGDLGNLEKGNGGGTRINGGECACVGGLRLVCSRAMDRGKSRLAVTNGGESLNYYHPISLEKKNYGLRGKKK